MSRQVMDRIFEPFFATKEPGKGAGLGLSMVFGYVKQARGHLSIHCETGLGSTFRIYLRRADETAEATPEAAPRQIALGREETVLVVEDNDAMRRVVVRQLRKLNYRVLEAASATEAIEGEAIDLRFTDMIRAASRGRRPGRRGKGAGRAGDRHLRVSANRSLRAGGRAGECPVAAEAVPPRGSGPRAPRRARLLRRRRGRRESS